MLSKLLADRGEEDSAHGRIAVGWSVAQDMATIVLVLLLGALLSESAGLSLVLGAFVAGLAASAEFSFVLARLGVDEQVVSETQFGVVVGATAASIVFGPLLFPPIPWMLARFGARFQPPPEDGPPVEARTHVVLCGHGRVGSFIAEILPRRGFRYVVIEQDRRMVERLREQGVEAIYGSAAHPQVLNRARLDRARTLVLALPDSLTTRLVAIWSRTFDVSPYSLFPQTGVGKASTAERNSPGSSGRMNGMPSMNSGVSSEPSIAFTIVSKW